MLTRHARISVAPRTILGYRPDGRPIYPIAGGSGEGDSGAGEGNDGATGDDPGGDTQRGSDDKPDGDTRGDQPDSDDKPEGTQTFDAAYVKTLRDEAAKHRTDKQASKDALEQIAKILNPDAEKPNAADLPNQLAEAQAASINTTRELAIYKAAGKNGADPDKLIDSRSFMDSVKTLDPASKDFATSVAKAIKDAVTSNPGFAPAQEAAKPRSNTVDHSGGSGEGNAKPTDLGGTVAARYATT